MCRALWRRERLDAGMQEEMRFHLEMEAERLMRERRLDAAEARRLAYVAFGGLEKYKDQGRDVRGLRWLDAVSIDARLGMRMLVKHRGLTLVGGFAMAVAIAIGATFFELLTEMLDSTLPIEQGERVVALRWTAATPGSAQERILHDFVEWREQLTSVEQLSAFRETLHNLTSGAPPHQPVRVAEISASAFIVARTPPHLGRYLLPEDEREGAPPVVVIGFSVWRSRFGGDPQIVGRTINLDGVPSTIVGVMPAGFNFPINHQFWSPLRENPLRYERLQGPRLKLFGRLAADVSLQEAQAELTTLGQRTIEANTKLYEGLRPMVLPYTHEHGGIVGPARRWMVRAASLLVGALSIVVAVNLAILVYARTVTRLGEIAVRTALGATRRRILAQLFVEALALSAVGAGAGLVLAGVALDQLQSLVLQGLLISDAGTPYWMDLEVSAGAVAYAFGLSIVAALIMGVLPGLKATSDRVSSNLRQVDVRSGNRLGPVWTTLIVAQVAVAVAVLPIAVYQTWQVVQMWAADPQFDADKFVIGVVAFGDEATGVDANRVRSRQLELTSRLAAEPGVAAVTFSSGVPGFSPGRILEFISAEPGVKYAGGLGVDSLDVGLELFDTYRAELVAGRTFLASDIGATNVVVNRTFVDELLDPAAALGVRFRYRTPYERPGTQAETMYQIVGVVRDFPAFPPEPGSQGTPTVYHPATPGQVHPVTLSVRFAAGIPSDFITRFRALGTAADPAMQFRRTAPLTAFYNDVRSFWRYLATGIALITLSVMLLSAAGIYAMTSFTVAQRGREIAIRTALGAAPHRLLLNIFGRAAIQLTAGLAVGSVLAAAIFQNADVSVGRMAAFVLAVGAAMFAIGLVATFGPARRGLRVQAADTLKADV
jgi:predicted permease